MSEYPNLAALRGELTEDDPDRRASAYQSVMQAGLEVSAVLGGDPDEAVVEQLAQKGVIPETTDDEGRPAHEVREEQVELLREIRDLLEVNDAA